MAERWAADAAHDLALGRAAARNALASYGAGRAPRYPALPTFMALRFELRQHGAEITPETHATFVAAYLDELRATRGPAGGR